jgi:tRNA-2-methylthio-N6-dimethylallyladenosine synthase
VVREVAEVVAAGARDVTLLGQSVMRYGIRTPVWPADHASAMGFTEPLPRLFEAIHAAVPALRRVRFTSGHPSGVTPELVRAMAELPCLCAHLHLPVQSGSDRILSAMGRGYTREEYLAAVARLRAAVPDIAITTDVIVGFPGETEDDFERTRTLLDEAEVDNVFVFKYSPRPGTRSSAWPDDVSAAEKMRRNQVLLEDQDRRGLAINGRWVGRTVEVLAEGPSLRNKARWSGRTEQNKIVVFDPVPGIAVGDFVRVVVTEAQPQTLHGRVESAG